MALIVKPSQFTATTLTPAALNTLMNTIYDEFGTTTNLQGNLTDANIAVAAAIGKAKIADTAVVCSNSVSAGTQTITRPTHFSAGALGYDFSAANTGSLPTGATPAIDRTKSVWKTQNGGATTITDLTGGVAGQVLHLIVNEANTTVGHTAGAPAANNKIKLKAAANYAATANFPRGAITLVFGDPTNSGFNSWWEV